MALLFCFYLIFSATALARHDWNPLWFVWIGERFYDLDPQGKIGYDGQFAYYIARDGVDAAVHLDVPAYRLQRILLPTIVRLLSFGNPSLIAWNLILVNFVAIAYTTYLLGNWLQEQTLSPWYAITYALYLGTFMAYSRDLNEPLAYALAGWGMIAWLNRKYPQAIIGFALGALAKEQALLFPIGVALASLWRWEIRETVWLSLSSIPLLIWEGYLWSQFQVIPVTQGSSPGIIPFYGILTQLTVEPGRFSAFLFVMVPALGLALLAIVWLIRGKRETAVWVLLIHAVFVLLLPTDVYDHVMHAGRNASGLILAAVVSFPLMHRWLRQGLLFCWVAPTFIWFIPVLRWAPWLSEI